MFAIEVTQTFSAAHALRLPGGGAEPLHGHDFRVTIKIAADKLDPLETVVDFHEVEAGLTALLSQWHNKNLNDLEPFKSRINPSAEQIASYIGHVLSKGLHILDKTGERRLRLAEVRITEAHNCLAIWTPD